MHDDDIRFEPRWTTQEVAKFANISLPTVRRYAQVLERECNHQFLTVNKRGDMRLSDYDITLFIEMKRLSRETGANVSQIAKMVMTKYGHEKDHPFQTEIQETGLATIPQDFRAVIERAGRQFWASAREEIMEDVRDVVRTEIKHELQVEMNGLKRQLAEMREAVTSQVAVSLEKQKKPWWKRRR